MFPGKYGASRIFNYNSIMRHYLEVPQLAAVMGQCIAGGAYLPALSDVIVMVEGTSFMGLGGPEPREGRHRPGRGGRGAGRGGDAQPDLGRRALPGARRRGVRREAARPRFRSAALARSGRPKTSPATRRAPAEDAYDILPDDHRQPYDVHDLLDTILDEGRFDEFQAGFAPEMLTAVSRLRGRRVGVIANRRGMFRPKGGGPPQFGGIVYADSAEKVAYFMDMCDRHRIPLLFVQDVSGFMVGRRGRALGDHPGGRPHGRVDGDGARAQARPDHEPRERRRLLRDGGAGLRPRLHLHLADRPHGRDGGRVRRAGGARARRMDRAAGRGTELDAETQAAIEHTRAEYDRQLDARYAAARGFVDAIIYPEETRDVLDVAHARLAREPGPHIGTFGLPAGVGGGGDHG